MNPGQMIKQIDAAIADEQQSHGLRNIMVQVAQMNGLRPTSKELDEAVQFVSDYIRHVPLLLLAIHGAAQKVGAQESIEPLLEACENYWNTGFDIIPDHLGLVGYTDDAYYVLSILQAIAERHRQADGNPLMNMQLTPMNRTMRGLIGEPYATVLDSAVATALAAPGLDAMLRNLLQFSGRPLVDRDPIWGNASVDEIVNARMGALGIV
jgi:uncharacterized membrane protein YkvA (DUF1232 family)